jgi:hypothetical protein
MNRFSPFIIFILLLGFIRGVHAVTFAVGTEFFGKAGQGAITFSQPFTASAMDSDGIKVMFTDFNMGELYGSIGFATSVGCSMIVQSVVTDSLVIIVTVTAELATSAVYTPGKPAPSKVTGAQSWSKNGDAVTLILSSGVHQVFISYAENTVPPSDDPASLTDLIPTSADISDFIEANIIYIIPIIAAGYVLSIPRGKRNRLVKKIRRRLR